jgi:peptidoglycan/xylan/chitin deacetylase (PgdA/CDA1 family)
MKDVIKLGISIVYLLAMRSKRFLLAAIGKRARRGCVVIYYHHVPDRWKKSYANQVRMLSRLTTPVRADGSDCCDRGKQAVAVTFDDGFEDFISNALPELERHQVPATVFVIAGRFGEVPGFDGYTGKLMSVVQVQSLPADLITIGSHTSTHPRMTEVTGEQALAELIESRSTLEKITGKPIELFSFPYGAFNPGLVEMARIVGYAKVFTTLPRQVYGLATEFEIGRVRVDPDDWDLEFILKILGGYSWLPKAIAMKARLRRVLSHARADAPTDTKQKNAHHATSGTD